MTDPCNENIDCDGTLSRVWAYLDGELSRDEAERFENHVSLCTSCDQAHDFERRLLEAIRATQHRDDPSTAALRDRVLTAIRGRLGSRE
jgi:anti-sigma factor (TIGR02949 family)